MWGDRVQLDCRAARKEVWQLCVGLNMESLSIVIDGLIHNKESEVKVGINRRISQNTEDGEARERHTESIGDLKDYSEGEKEAYLLIQNSRQIANIIIQEERKLGHNKLADSLEKISISEKPKYNSNSLGSTKNESGLWII